MSLDSSSSLIWATIIMPMSREFMTTHPQRSSFYPLTSKFSSRGSSVSSPTSPGVQLTHFSSPSQLSIARPFPNAGAPWQPHTPCSAKEGLQLWSPDSFTHAPSQAFPHARKEPGRDFWEQSMHTWTRSSSKFFQTSSCRESSRTLAADQDGQVTCRLCPSSSRRLPGSCCALRPTSTPINKPNEPTATSVNSWHCASHHQSICSWAAPSFDAPSGLAFRLWAFWRKHLSPLIFPTRASTDVVNNSS